MFPAGWIKALKWSPVVITMYVTVDLVRVCDVHLDYAMQ